MGATIGFISVRHQAEHGYFGGYLIVNPLARPLEFHCTLPVQPSRAQTLLYGPTIDDFLCGEQIAKALTTKAKLRPDLIIADCPAVLALTNVSTANVVYYDASKHLAAEESATLRIPASPQELQPIDVQNYRFHIARGSNVTSESVASVIEQLAASFVLAEPFGRIVEALTEANPVVKAA